MRIGVAEVGEANFDDHGGNAGTGVAQAQRAELDRASGSDPDGAAIFEFDLGAAGILGGDLHALHYRHVEKCIFVALPRVAVDDDGALDVAQSHDSCLRIGECGHASQHRRRQNQRRTQAPLQHRGIPVKPACTPLEHGVGVLVASGE